MRKYLNILLIVSINGLSGCIISNESDNKAEETEKNDSLSASQYLMAVEGAVGTWDATKTDSEGNVIETYTYSYTVKSNVEKDGISYMVFENSLDGTSSLFRIADNSLCVVMEELADTELQMFNFNAQQGDSWNIIKRSQTEDGVSVDYTMDGMFMGLEDISVPGGDYKDCAKFMITVTENIVFSINGQEISETRVTKESRWLAPLLGPIKTVSQHYGNDVLVEQTTDVFTSFSF